MKTSTPSAWPIILWAAGIAILAPPGSAQSPADDVQNQLTADFNEAYRTKEWPRAIELGRQLIELAPENSTHAYNLACVYALHGDKDSAGTWLVKAAENGFDRLGLFTSDPDLADIRGLPAFQTALALVKASQEKAFERLKKKFLEHPPLVVLPSGHDKIRASPLIIALHGYGCQAKMMTTPWVTVADQIGAILVAPQAVHKVNGGTGYSWLAPGDTTPDEPEFLVRLTLELVRKDFKIDPDRTILTGFSQGGFVAYAVGARAPHVFPGVIPMGAGYIPAIDAPPQATGAQRARFYFMVGERDVAVGQTRRAAEAFAAAGFEVKLRVYPGVGHAFPNNTIEELHDAVEFVLER